MRDEQLSDSNVVELVSWAQAAMLVHFPLQAAGGTTEPTARDQRPTTTVKLYNRLEWGSVIFKSRFVQTPAWPPIQTVWRQHTTGRSCRAYLGLAPALCRRARRVAGGSLYTSVVAKASLSDDVMVQRRRCGRTGALIECGPE